MGKLSSNPLFSSIVTLYTLILLYFPQFFFNLIVSPPFISTLILLLALLRLGASQQNKQQQQPTVSLNKSAHAPLQYETHNNHNNNNLQSGLGLGPSPKPKTNLVEDDQRREGKKEVEKLECNNLVLEPHATLEEPDPSPKPETFDQTQLREIDIFTKKDQNKEAAKQKGECLGWAQFEPVFSPNLYLEWDVGAPLEVIYEAYEGVEGGGEAQNDAFCSKNESCKNMGIMMDRYPSLSRYYPESDSDSDSNLDIDMDMDMDSKFSYIDEGGGKEGLIEIALDCDDYDDYYYDKGIINVIMKSNNKVIDYEELNFDDEDNLIEIDISRTKTIS